MTEFRVEGHQLGVTQTETMAHPGECRHFGHATKLHSFKSHDTHEDPRFGVPIPVTVGTSETKATLTPHEDFGCIPWRGVGGRGVYRHTTRNHIHIYIYIYEREAPLGSI